MPEPNTDGTLKNICGVCKRAIWVSAAGQKMMARGVKVVCNRCAPPAEQVQGVEITADTILELFEQLLLDAEREGGSPKKIFDVVKRICELPQKPSN